MMPDSNEKESRSQRDFEPFRYLSKAPLVTVQITVPTENHRGSVRKTICCDWIGCVRRALNHPARGSSGAAERQTSHAVATGHLSDARPQFAHGAHLQLASAFPRHSQMSAKFGQ